VLSTIEALDLTISHNNQVNCLVDYCGFLYYFAKFWGDRENRSRLAFEMRQAEG
jgi:hypothetical protein